MKVCLLGENKKFFYPLKKWLLSQKCLVVDYRDPLKNPQDLFIEEFDVIVMYADEQNHMFDIVKRIRESDEMVIIIYYSDDDKLESMLRAFELGVDDYIVGPSHIDELIARCKVIIKRLAHGIVRETRIVNGFEINTADRRIAYDDKELPLSLTEFRLLNYFLSNYGQSISRDRLESKIWENAYEKSPNLLTTYINRLRKKLAKHTNSNWIKTHRGIGYKFEKID